MVNAKIRYLPHTVILATFLIVFATFEPSRGQDPAANPIQEFQGLSVEAIQAAYSSKHQTVFINLSYRNKTREPVVLGLVWPSEKCYAVDDKENRYRFARGYGLNGGVIGARWPDDAEFLELGDNAMAKAGFTFNSRMDIEGEPTHLRLLCPHVSVDLDTREVRRRYPVFLRDVDLSQSP